MEALKISEPPWAMPVYQGIDAGGEGVEALDDTNRLIACHQREKDLAADEACGVSEGDHGWLPIIPSTQCSQPLAAASMA